MDSKQEEFAANAKRVTAARDRVREMMDQKRLSLEDGAKERFANFERILNEAPAICRMSARFAKRSKKRRRNTTARARSCARPASAVCCAPSHALRNNPTAASRRHKGPFEQLKRIQQRDEEKKHSA